jgi:hypothetical protein
MTFVKLSLVTISKALRKEIGWVIANLVGMSVGILFDLWWVIVPRSKLASPVEMALVVVWGVIVLTILFVTFIVNTIWLIQLCRRNHRLARRRALGAWLLVCCLWLVPVSFNRLAITLVVLATGMIDGTAWHH